MEAQFLQGLLQEIRGMREDQARREEELRATFRQRDEELQLLRTSQISLSNNRAAGDFETRSANANAFSNNYPRSELGFKIKPDTFDGTTSLREFFSQFELIARANCWADATKTVVLASCLRGKARSVLETVEDLMNLEFSELKSKLELRFGERFGEDLTAYGTELERLSRLAYAECPHDVHDKIACAQFVSGVYDGFTRRTLQLERISSLNLAVERAKAIKIIQGGNFRREREDTYGISLNEERGKSLGGKELKSERNDKPATRKKSETDQRKNWRDNKYAAKREECWTCGKFGHFRSECPASEGNSIKVDTGSDISIVSEEFIEKGKKRLQVKVCNLKYPTVEKVSFQGKVLVKVQVGKYSLEIPMYVAKISDDCLLGVDFLRKINLTNIFYSVSHNSESIDEEIFDCARVETSSQGVPSVLEELYIRNSQNLIDSQKKDFAAFLRKFKNVFSQETVAGNCEVLEHVINLKDCSPIKQVLRRIPLQLRGKVERMIEDMRKQGVIEESQSPWISPAVLVKKRNGALRFCVDYRKLNAVTIKDSYPLPRIDDIFDQLSVYLDDVVVFGKSFEEMLENLGIIFQRIQEVNLKINPEKCVFFSNSVKYLGHVISKEGITTDEEKISAVKDWSVPHTKKQLRSFIGFCSYYRKFVRGFSSVAKPLFVLTEDKVKFSWGPECQSAFDELKRVLSSSPVLPFPNEDGEFILDTDASNVGIGAVLSQKQEEKERVIAYFSHVLNKAERNYCVTRRELLAIVEAIKFFRHYLLGRKFLIRTDHFSLKWLMSFRDLEGQLARWLERLQRFEFEIIYRKGCSHGNADGLSRRPCESLGCKYCAKIELKGTQEPSEIVARITIPKKSMEDWRKDQTEDPSLLIFISGKETGERPICSENVIGDISFRIYSSYWDALCLRDGVLYKRWNGPLGKGKSPLQVYNVGTPFERVQLDILGPLPSTTNKNKYLLVLVDCFTKWVEAFPVKNIKAKTIAEIFVNQIDSRHGVPLESDGQVERQHQTITNFLAKYISSNQKDWDRWIPIFLMAYRTSKHEATGYTPAELYLGRDLRLPLDFLRGSPPECHEQTPFSMERYVRELRVKLKEIGSEARRRLKMQSFRVKARYDNKARQISFQEGQKVWLFNPRRQIGRAPKLQNNWEGPYMLKSLVRSYFVSGSP
ncbi:PREDICTED: uncharacterized protein LOC105556439 [Vollenhovia emeryi]|uniref:uncharacterized protein LOC105556439 n=1 Tax=Vollenhovia emeryi TaxID=411798 RepID=UPI0005F435D4|nr:PREDICTED: uncharacterized protein LOC105556439 [Vollenhovia emeryi]